MTWAFSDEFFRSVRYQIHDNSSLYHFFMRPLCPVCAAGFGRYGIPDCPSCVSEGKGVCSDFGISNGLPQSIIKNMPSMPDYIAAMVKTVESKHVDTENKLRPILSLLTETINRGISLDELGGWPQLFAGNEIWPTDGPPFFVCCSELIHNDDPFLAAKFAQGTVPLRHPAMLHLGDASSELGPLLDLLQVPRLTSLVETQTVEGMVHVGVIVIEDIVEALIRFGQLVLIVNHPVIYQQHEADGSVRATIKALKMFVVEELAVYTGSSTTHLATVASFASLSRALTRARSFLLRCSLDMSRHRGSAHSDG